MKPTITTCLRVFGAGLLVLWAWLIYVYFLRTNFVLLNYPGAPLGVFSGLFGVYTFSLGNSPPVELLQVLIVTTIALLTGMWTARALCGRLPLWEALPVGYTLGIGTVGIGFVLVTMAGLLRTVVVWPMVMILLGGAWWLSRRAPVWLSRQLPETDFAHDEGDFLASWRAQPLWRRIAGIKMLALGLLITAATFWHAVFIPETYWDSLILYLGYGRMTFLEGAFPFKAEAQVGIGLGANYPHLYSTWGAGASMMFNHWTDLHARFASPLCGLLAMMFVYTTCWRVWRDHLVAAMAALLFRALANGIAYTTYSSDYAFAILLCSAFLHAAVLFAQRRTWGTYILFTAIPAISMNLNFLMGILWAPWLAVMVALPALSSGSAPWSGMWRLARNGTVWIVYLAAIVVATPWYIRNTVLTGNPVYAFFPEIFTASIRVNTEVLRSAELEWFRNGDGIARLAELWRDWEAGERRDEGSPDFRREAGLRHRLLASFPFWVGFDVLRFDEEGMRGASLSGRLAHLLRIHQSDPNETRLLGEETLLLRNHHSYKMTPLFPAFVFPGLAVWMVWFLWRASRRRLRLDPVEAIACLATVVMVLSLLGYMYFLADFYLYQIIGVIGPAAVLAGGMIALIARGPGGRFLIAVLAPMILLQGIAPGLAFSLMGFKFSRGNAVVYGQVYSPFALDAFRNPGIPPALFWRMQYGESPNMWDYINANLVGERLLTHENRHYVLDPSITLIHLDDWDMQQGYDLGDPTAIVEFLKSHDITYYLRTENEFRHHINARLGMHLLDEEWLTPVYTAGSDVLYRIGR